MCSNCRIDRPSRPYAHHLGHRVSQLCAECAGALTAMGMTLTPVERRLEERPVARDRRRFVPRWLGRTKVLDHGVAA